MSKRAARMFRCRGVNPEPRRLRPCLRCDKPFMSSVSRRVCDSCHQTNSEQATFRSGNVLIETRSL